jgi:hypothetical protein
MEIHHLVLKRLDGSVLRQDFLADGGPAPRVGSMVAVAVRGAIRVPARVSVVETFSAATRLNERTVHAKELLCVPVAANDP